MENTTTNNETALLWFAGLFFAFLIIFGIVMYLSERFKDINYAKMEICRSYGEDEYRYWRRELTICRLLLIPFMSYERAKRIVRFFSRGRHAKKEKHNDGLTSLLLPSFLGIMICAVCLAGGTFAWFTASQGVPTQTIVAAEYSVATTVTNAETVIEAQNGAHVLEAGKEYTVTLKATGTASTGYCVVKLNGEMFRPTVQFPTKDNTEKEISFTLVMNEAATLTVESQWGSAAWKNAKIEDGGSYTYGEVKAEQEENPTEDEKETPDTTEKTDTTEPPAETGKTELDPEKYTVKSGDSLGKIADLYGTSATKLAAYNGIEDPSKIYPGQVIKIPPADWKIPETTTEETTPPVTEPEATESKPSETEPSETGSETAGGTTETTVPQETTGTEPNPSESDGNE